MSRRSKNYVLNGIIMRECLGCGPKPLAEFDKYKHNTESRCRECTRKMRIGYYQRAKARGYVQRRGGLATHQIYVNLDQMQFIIDAMQGQESPIAKEIRAKCANRLAKERKKLGLDMITTTHDVHRVLSTSKFAKYAQRST
jgi:hypothetical protein